MFTSKKFFAFTLAEALVVMAALGVLAALTLPTLLSNTSKRHYKAAFAKLINTLQNNNDMLLHDSDALRLSEICGDDYLKGCLSKVTPLFFNEQFGWYISKDNIAYNVIAIGEDGITQNNIFMKKFYLTGVDLNGISKPNEDCVDRFVVWISDDGTVIDTEGCSTEYAKLTPSGGVKIVNANGVKVSKIVSGYKCVDCSEHRNNPDFQYCGGEIGYANDCWAGAIKECGGIKNLPTPEDMYKISQYVYNNENIRKLGFTQGTYDSDRYQEFIDLGMPDQDYNYVWTSESKSWQGAGYQMLSKYGSADMSTNNNIGQYKYAPSSNHIAFCVEHDEEK